MKYFLRNYCSDCLGEDSDGCFNGGYEKLDNSEATGILDNLNLSTNGIPRDSGTYLTEDVGILHKIGKKIHNDCGLYEYQIVTEDLDLVFDSVVVYHNGQPKYLVDLLTVKDDEKE